MKGKEKVVIVGYRPQIGKVLEKKNIPYVIWSSKTIKTKNKSLSSLIEPMSTRPEKIASVANCLKEHGPFTHVIAGTEESVTPASYLRRALDARTSKHTIIKSCHDKLLMKQKLQEFDTPMTPFIYLKDTKLNVTQIIKKLDSPLIVKARNQSGGRGTQLISTHKELKPYIKTDTIAEKFVNAPEASIESYIQDGKILFTNVTQYYENGSINLVPAHYSAKLMKSLRVFNNQIIQSLKINWGLTHLEVYITENGPLFGEIAVRPPGGYIMELISEAYGFDSWEAFVNVELGYEFSFKPRALQFCSSWILHPNEGKVVEVGGFEKIQNHKNTFKSRLKVKPGDQIKPRLSVGKNVGYVLSKANSQDELIKTIKDYKRSFVLETVSAN